jgi:aminoglycoside phosphotransferase (APT) family kinase protein
VRIGFRDAAMPGHRHHRVSVMTPEQAGALWADLGRAAARTVGPILGGWASWTFELDGTWILQVARKAEVAAGHQRQAQLLPELARAMSVAVPEPVEFGTWHGCTYLAYRKIPGRPLTPQDNWRDLAKVLQELHEFPLDRAAAALGVPATNQIWRSKYADLWSDVRTRVLPTLDHDLRVAVDVRFTEFLDSAWDFPPTLVHADLGAEHVLVDQTGSVSGLIDFETAAIGDPAVDFAALLPTLGEGRVHALMEAYGRPVDLQRMRGYHWLGSLFAVQYGMDSEDPETIRDGVAGLRARLQVN